MNGIAEFRMAAFTHRARTVLLAIVSSVLVVLTGIVMVVMLDMIAASRAFLSGQHQWTSAVHLAVINLDRYAETGNPDLLDVVRDHLRTPLSDRIARIELERKSPDYQRALEHLTIGREHADQELPGLIRQFRLIHNLEPFREAVEQWRETDLWILRLAGLAAELERLHEDDPVADRDQLRSIRRELTLINQSILERTDRFVQLIGGGSRALTNLAFLISSAAIVLLAVALALVFHWAYRGIRRSQRQFLQMFERAPVGMALLNPDGTIRQANDSLCRLLEQPADRIIGKPLIDFCDLRDRAELARFLEKSRTEKTQHAAIECRYSRPDNFPAWGKLSLSNLKHISQQQASIIAVLEDVSEARTLAEELAYQAAHDQLTGLPNRREFERGLNKLLHETDSASGRHALGLIDLDQFKIVNDAFGHLAGDAILVRLAERISQCLRDQDTLARLDGDEFGVILRDCEIETATQVANRLRDAISAFRFVWEGQPINVSASIGMVEIKKGKHDASWLMQRVDFACHEAKEQGRNQVRVHSELVDTAPLRQEQMLWVHRIKDAVSSDRMRFHGQLMMPHSGDQWRCELLVRLQDQDGVVHTAERFVETAERYHIARMLDQWVLKNALDQVARIQHSIPEICIWHINLSGQSVNCETVLPQLLSLIRQSGIPAERLCFEITESAAMHSLAEAREFFGQIRDLGCEIALDDFGKGVSTFDYLKQIPVDVVKIDGSFVRELAHSELDHAMVRSVHEIARVAGLKTVAESVESMELIMRLRQIGIDFMQGHVIHSPVPLEMLRIPGHENQASPTAAG